MEFYSAFKKNEVLPSVVTWISLILSKISQTEKERYSMITHMWNMKKKKKQPKNNEFMDVENRLVVARHKSRSMGIKRYKHPAIK